MPDPVPVDVLVVGAGAAGAALAWRLATRGVDVLCLERGGWPEPERYPPTRADWETRRLRDWSINPNVRRLPADYPIADDTSAIKPAIWNGVGGSTVMWSAHAPRFHPSDFRVRTLDGVGADWPLDYAELEPYYDLNDRLTGVCGIAGDPANPPRSPRQTPPLPLGPGGVRLARAFESLGWHWWPCDGNINSAPYDGRPACNGCGPCELGCPTRAKASADVTYWPKAIAAGARVVTDAAVAQIAVDARGRASGVHYVDADGVERFQAARVVVLAANGIGTPRLLLHSGIGNGSGLVGRGLMLHPIAAVSGVFDEDLQTNRGANAFSIFSHEFYESDPSRGFVRGYQLQVTRAQGPLMTALGGFAHHVPWGAGHHRRFEQVCGRYLNVAICCEDLADDANRIELEPAQRDHAGVPGARMTYRVDENSQRMLAHAIDRATEVLDAAGAVDTRANGLLAPAGFHLMGTTRMGDDPATSVVDRHCRSHDVPNLLVVDGGVFVTAAGVNPTPTIQALALRAADHLLAARAAGDLSA